LNILRDFRVLTKYKKYVSFLHINMTSLKDEL